MKTKLVYAVVSGENAPYLSQAFVAVYTARRYNPNAEILLVVDQDTNDVLEAKLSKIKDYINQVIVVKTPSDMSKMHRSRFLKTTLRKSIKGDFLYIDTDTVVCEDLSSIDEFDAEVAATLDRHSLVSEHPLIFSIEKNISSVDLTINDLHDKYFNGGVMYVKDTPVTHRLFEAWHRNWDMSRKKTTGIDQPPLALANKQCGYPIKELGGIWNCQLCDNFMNYLFDAKILHYFASDNKSPYKLNNDSIWKKVNEENSIPQWLIEDLEHPKKMFVERSLLIYGSDLSYQRSYVHTMFVFHRKIYNFFEYISKVIVEKKLW